MRSIPIAWCCRASVLVPREHGCWAARTPSVLRAWWSHRAGCPRPSMPNGWQCCSTLPCKCSTVARMTRLRWVMQRMLSAFCGRCMRRSVLRSSPDGDHSIADAVYGDAGLPELAGEYSAGAAQAGCCGLKCTWWYGAGTSVQMTLQFVIPAKAGIQRR